MVKLLFLLFLFLFPLGQIARLDLGNGITLLLNDFLVVSVVIMSLIFNYRKNVTKSYLFKPIGIFTGIATLSLILSLKSLSVNEVLISSLYLLRWVSYAGLFFVVSGFDKDFKRKILNILIFVSSIVLIGGYVQYFFYPNLRNLFYLGWDEHIYRMFSSFLDPNFLGAFLVLSLVLVIGKMKSLYKNRINKKLIILAVLSFLYFVGILLTYSRSSIITLILVISLLLVLYGKKIWIAFFIISTVFLLFLLPQALRTESTNWFRTTSTFARVESVQKVLTIFKDYPIFGVGFDTYRYIQRKYNFLDNRTFLFHSGAGTDNSFLFVLVTTGIIGFLSYLYIWFEVLKHASRDYKTNIFSAIIIVSVIGIMVNSFFVNSLFYPFIMEWLWIVIGLRENK